MPPPPPRFQPKLLPDQAQLSKWLDGINRFNPRLTGNAPHQDSIDYLEQELHDIGGLSIHRDALHLKQRWEAKTYGLSIVGNAQSINVSSYVPYSGVTGPGGVTGELLHYPRFPFSFWRAKGKIALVDVRLRALPRFALRLLLRVRGRYPGSADLPAWFSSPLSLLYKKLHLEKAAEAGVKGVIYIWRNCSDPNAVGQYLPFDTPYANCPALWVNGTEGDKLVRAAKRGESVELVLEANIQKEAPTDTLWAVLPGSRSDQTIIVNTHTDGPNTPQENGVVGLLALASYFSKLAKQGQLQRTLVFVFVTGHFQLPQLVADYPPNRATHTWLEAHRDLWDGAPGHKTAVAATTLEHLGCTEWKDTAGHSGHGPTGQMELEIVYASNAKLNEIYLGALQGRTLGRTVTVKPLPVYLGEGQPPYVAGIPTLSLITLPDYMCAATANGEIHKLDLALMSEQIETFAKTITELDGLQTQEIGTADRPGLLDRLFFGILKRLMGR
jgi:hypothetical protein